MPNASNIDAPIVLVGPGRSGTSLLSSVFGNHADCASVGETVNFIFGIWTALHASASLIPPLVEAGRTVPDDERAGRLVREAFLTTLPDDRGDWMQKPIGVPNVLVETFRDDSGSDEAAAFYWRVLRSSFPRARYITLLRHPCDVVLSGVAHWGQDEVTLWTRFSDLARFMTHPDAPPVHAVMYDDLVGDPEKTVRELCTAVGLSFEPSMLDAFKRVHVAAPGREAPERTAFSRRHEWSGLNPAWVTTAQRDSLTALFARFGRTLDWPDAFTSAHPVSSAVQPDAERIAELETLVDHMKASFERRRLEHEARAREREAHFAQVWQEQRAWIAELERGKAWLEEQRNNWRAEAERLKRHASEN
jgi:hypothetical protein